jgi:hypothetical protein
MRGAAMTLSGFDRGRLIMFESALSSQLTPPRLRIARVVPVTHDPMLDLRDHADTQRSNLIYSRRIGTASILADSNN